MHQQGTRNCSADILPTEETRQIPMKPECFRMKPNAEKARKKPHHLDDGKAILGCGSGI